MKKIIHVGILTGLMLSNAALAETKDEFAHMRNNPNNMTAEQAEQVEAGFINPKLAWDIAREGVKWGKRTWDAYQKSKYVKPAAEKAAGAAGYYGAYRAGYNDGKASD